MGTTKRLFSIPTALGLVLGLLIGAGAAATVYTQEAGDARGPGSKAVTVQRLTGHVVNETQNYDLTLAAIRIERNEVAQDGVASLAGSLQVQGVAVNGLRGRVVEAVPPTTEHDYWCVNVAIESNPALEGYNFLWYIRDSGDGHDSFDELAHDGGAGLTCAQASMPTDFRTVTKGDFRSSL